MSPKLRRSLAPQALTSRGFRTLLYLIHGNAPDPFKKFRQFRKGLEISFFLSLNMPNVSTPFFAAFRLTLQPDPCYKRLGRS